MSIDINKIAGNLSKYSNVKETLRHGLDSVLNTFGNFSEDRKVSQAILGLIKGILKGHLLTQNEDSIRTMLEGSYSPSIVDKLLKGLEDAEVVSIQDAANQLSEISLEEKSKLLNSLINLSIGTNCFDENIDNLKELAFRFDIDEQIFQNMVDEAGARSVRKAKIIRSGAGIITALVVILVFVLTATLLRSVIFGLIAAYLLLPLEMYFERRFKAKSGFFFRLFSTVNLIFSPLKKLSKILMKKRDDDELSDEKTENIEQRKITAQAVGATTLSMFVVAAIIFGGISTIANHYVENVSKSVATWQQEHAEEKTDNSKEELPNKNDNEIIITNSATEKFFQEADSYLDKLRLKVENLPLVKLALESVSKVLNDPESQSELVNELLKRTGGLFSITASVVGNIATIIGDLLLTIFFFLLFLTKLAEFCAENKSAGKQSEYLVRTVFNGNWLPGASADTIAEAQRIISGVISRLRIWVRGYITLMLVDATIYTIAFYFLKVPYFWLLGPIAGMGILLPYIGPIVSVVLTLLVSIAAGGIHFDGSQMFAIIITYIIYNGIIEQFILYPMVIGESLGLTTLETIIVVLLGAIFAGIPGMILAIPTSSVLKYLVPQIYKCWEKRSPINNE